jgi:uncharacterized protein YjeT (DUF2065 family)
MSEIFGKVYGLYFVLVAVAAMLRPERYRRVQQQFIRDDALALIAGVLAFFLGAFTVALHNVWVNDWPVIVTLIGWISLIKGAILLLSDQVLLKLNPLTRMSDQTFRLVAVFWLLLGIFLLWSGCASECDWDSAFDLTRQ